MTTFENQESELEAKPNPFFSYHGSGVELFKVYIVNVLLTLVTLGLYYPWAKAKILRYHYAELEFKGARFAFHGTGKEMFKGFIKAIVIFGVLIGLLQYLSHLMIEAQMNGESISPYLGGIMFIYVIIFLLTPLAIVGTMKYRASRSSYRGIHFKYVGTVKGMYQVFIKGFLLSIVTFGFYAPWFTIDIIKECIKNLRLGNIKFLFTGEGSKLFVLQLKGVLLMMLTFYIYIFRFQSHLHDFYYNNFRLIQGDKKGTLYAQTSGFGFFKMLMFSFFVIIVSGGLAAPWAIVYQIRYFANTTKMKGSIDFDNIEQGEVDDADATGEGIFDMLDLDIA